MFKRSITWSTVVCCQFLISCQEVFLQPNPGNNAEAIFETLWKDFNTSYPSFEIRGINWESVYMAYKPKIHPQLSDEELFLIIKDMLAELKDGHVTITSPSKTYYYPVGAGYPCNYLGTEHIKSKLFNTFSNRVMLAGTLQDSIGYLAIYTWGGSLNEYQLIDKAIGLFEPLKGVIIDLRNNGGGSDQNANEVAGRFADQKRLGGYVRWKVGPQKNDLGEFIPSYLVPKGKKQLTNRPVLVLTNRKCYSSTEHFIAHMRVLPWVKQVGDTTGGGSGNPIRRELPNGWSYQVTRWIEYQLNKKTFEVNGIAPHFPVWISKTDSLANKDTILESAIVQLR